MRRNNLKEKSMKPITVKIAFVVALGCAAAIIEARSSQKLDLEVCLWIALGVVVLLLSKNGRSALKASEKPCEIQGSYSGLSVPGRPAPRQTGGATGRNPSGRQAETLSC